MLLRSALLTLCACLLPLASPASAQADDDLGQVGGPGHQGAAGTGFTSTHFGLYDKTDSGNGNPFLDEELSVLEAIVVYDYNVTDDFGYALTFSYDNVSSASIDRLSNFPNQSGASGDFYFGLDFATRHKSTEQVTWGSHIGASAEYDYQSIGLGGSVAMEADDRNSSLTLSLDAFLDQVDIIRFDGSDAEGSDDRTSIAGTASWYRLMSPTMHGEFGVTLSTQSGFLETPFNSVIIEDGVSVPPFPFANGALGFEVPENHPDSRLRTALFGRVRQLHDDDTAFELGGRIYNDDWGIQAFSIEPRWYEDLVEDEVRLRFRYRYYTQSEADFYGEHFLPGSEFGELTQDSDLADFDSHTIGAKLSLLDAGKRSFDVSLDYVSRSDGLDHLLGLFGWTWHF